jgi:hypothetical protein
MIIFIRRLQFSYGMNKFAIGPFFYKAFSSNSIKVGKYV